MAAPRLPVAMAWRRPRPMRLASRQAESMAENDRYWPKGFFDELVAMSGADLDDLPLSARLEDMYQRAAEELTADVIADPRRFAG